MDPVPTANPLNAVIRVLGVSLAITCAGMAAATFRGDGTAINAFLFMAAGMSHGTAGQVERWAMMLVLTLSVIAMARPHWALLLPVAAYIFADALALWHQRGAPFSEWALAARALRYITPLVMILLLAAAVRPGREGNGWRMAGEWGLRIGAATVFAVHGFESLKLHPGFLDFIMSTGMNLFDVRITEADASTQLWVIGVVDLVVAAAIMARASGAVLWWAAFWGAITALSRMTAYGWGAYPEVLMRATHVLGPAALWWLARANREIRETK